VFPFTVTESHPNSAKRFTVEGKAGGVWAGTPRPQRAHRRTIAKTKEEADREREAKTLRLDRTHFEGERTDGR